jgi:putative Mg2+ transporter-C (MgtC) family protein
MERFSTLVPSWEVIGLDVFKLAVAYVLALPIGLNREREERSAGLRTFPIVAVAACGFVILGESMPGASPDALSRILQGLITGIGFIGGGAILRDKAAVTGTATAASIWSIGIVGAAVGFGVYHIAVVLTIINLLTFKFLTPIKHHLDARTDEETR